MDEIYDPLVAQTNLIGVFVVWPKTWGVLTFGLGQHDRYIIPTIE